ncbi:hypothetical protein ACIHFD_04675 [Nonomuraea sp. NPDC051941]|uniref:hypothetical protein n=1 Tax=Nonomuraea sp. NPDC051941 TaxID=3364373 RepID=UPI0037C8F65A
MLTEALAALAAAAGTGVVTAMTTDAWEEIKTRCARLLGRGDADGEKRQVARLELARRELLAAQDHEQTQREQQAVWTTLLRELLEDQPDSEEQVRELMVFIAEWTPLSSAVCPPQINAQAYGHAQQAVQGQGVQNVTFGQPRI